MPTGPVTGRMGRHGTLTGWAGSRALSMSAMAIGSLTISRWSLASRTHWRLTVILVTFDAAGRKALVYGVTTSSSLVSMTVYWTAGTVGFALRLVRNGEPASCGTQAAHWVASRVLMGT